MKIFQIKRKNILIFARSLYFLFYSSIVGIESGVVMTKVLFTAIRRDIDFIILGHFIFDSRPPAGPCAQRVEEDKDEPRNKTYSYHVLAHLQVVIQEAGTGII